MHFQASLPRLPIPELSKSCQRYLAAIQPLATPEEYSRTQRIVQEFEQGEGKILHEELLQRDKKNKQTSYISGPWFDMYLRSRIPLVINYNPFMTFKPDPKPEYNKQVLRATNMLISSLRFMKSLRSNLLEPEVYHLNSAKSDTPQFRTITRLLPSRVSWYGAYLFKAFPLDMSQYSGLFNGTRIPKPSKDVLVNDPTAKHMLVIKNGRFYVFDALDRDGNLLPASVYHAILDYIAKLPDTVPSHGGLGYLPTADRNKWAETRQHLERSGNVDLLRSVDTALFALVLDDQTFDGDFIKGASGMLHGPAYNRWFDKSVQLLVGRDSTAWVNFEHSWGDGVAILRYFNEIYADSTERPRIHPQSVPATNVDVSKLVRELEFNLDDRSKMDIQEAKKNYESLTNSLSIDAILSAKKYLNRDYLKKQKLSPDSVLQLAFQLAYYREHGKTPASYEACSTAAFRHGRTETVRPASTATKRFTEAVCRRQPPPAGELRAMMHECSKHHSLLTKEAAMGQGFDRHLFVLKEQALSNGKLPALYQDPVYQRANYYLLSSSTLSGDCFLGGGFGPVVEDGYGIAYGYMDSRTAGTLVSSYEKHHDATRFLRCIGESMDTLCDVLKATENK